MGTDQLILVILASLILVGLVVLEVFFKKNEKYRKILSLILKISACVLVGLYAIRSILNDSFVWIINNAEDFHGTIGSREFHRHDYLQSFLRWGYMVSVCIIPTAAFFKSKTVRRFAVIVPLATVVLSIIYYADYMKYFTTFDTYEIEFDYTNKVRGIMTSESFRHVEFDLEIIFMAICSLIICATDKLELLPTKALDLPKFFGFLPTLFLVAIPVYLPQSLFGYTRLQMSLFSPQHFIWLGGTVVLLFIIYFVFRDKSITVKKAVVCYLCVFLFLHYNSIFMWIIEAKRLPFQLCNIGCYCALIAFAFHKFPKMQKFFNFVFVINISGALFAAIGFDLGDGLLALTNVHYYLEHIYLFIIPYLMVAFGIYQLPGKNAFVHATIGFSIFFLVCVFTGLYFNGVMLDKPLANGKTFWTRCNYFYIFDIDDATEVFNFLSFAKKWPVTLNDYRFYPLLMIAIYVGFLPFSFVMFIINKKLILVGKDHGELRARRHLLKKKETESC